MDEMLFGQILESVEQADKFIKGEQNDCHTYQMENSAANSNEIKNLSDQAKNP